MERCEDLALHAEDGNHSDKSYDDKVEISKSSSEQVSPHCSHNVTCIVSIAVAIFKEHEQCTTEKRKKEAKKEASIEVVEAPKAEGYYSIEYNMLPGDPELTRVDLVMFGLAAKLFMASETKVLKPWREGNQVWVSWSQTLRLNVTRELLIKMASHKITVRVWESKDKVSFKAKNDRPKAFRIPQERSKDDPEHMGGIKKTVCKMRAALNQDNLKVKEYIKHSAFTKSELTKEQSQKVQTKKPLFPKLTQQIEEVTEVQPEKEAASLELSLSPLLAGSLTVIESLRFCCKGVMEGFWSITLDQQLLSEQLKVELNPLVIRVLSASSLPSPPVQGNYLPVHCQYKFHTENTHRTKGHAHSTDIHFRDVNVIFIALMRRGKLNEFLRGPPMEIQVHDHDKLAEKPLSKPAIFGTDPDDSKISAVDLWRNAFSEGQKHEDTYGVAKLDLSEFLNGCTYLKQTLPVLHFGHSAMPLGQYVEAGTQLKIQVEIAYPLHSEDDEEDEECPIGRIVYIFKYNNADVFNKLTSEILQINAGAFKLNHYSEDTIQRVLSGLKIANKERNGEKLDVLTGFHVVDKDLHLLVLEGLRNQAVKRLWTTVAVQLEAEEEKRVAVLYNSDMSFSKRLYETFDVGLSPTCLLKPLETIMKEPLVFIRNAVPHPCLQAMKCLIQLRQAKSLQEAVRNNMFPSAGMILSLKKEFGQDLWTYEPLMIPETQEAEDLPDHRNIRKRTYTLLDNLNMEYVQRNLNEGQNKTDYIQANIEDVHRASDDLQKLKTHVFFENVLDNPTNDYKDAKTFNLRAAQPEYFSYISFSYPGFKSSIESNQHPKRPHDARIEELKKPWRENVLHVNKLKPTLSRSCLPWIQRNEDFDLYSKAPAMFGPKLPLSIQLAGKALDEEQLQVASAQYNRWLSKTAEFENIGSEKVPEFRCHMRKVGLDKPHDMLKDKPMKYSLRRPGMALKPIPVTSVVQFSERHGSAEEVCIPYAPGPFQKHSLSWEKNAVQRHSSQFNKFHFRSYWIPHPIQHKRAASALTEEEKCTFDFHTPAENTQTPLITAGFKQNGNIIEMSTNKRVTLHVQ